MNLAQAFPTASHMYTHTHTHANNKLGTRRYNGNSSEENLFKVCKGRQTGSE